jgi:putative phage-type endonuclease
MTAATVQQAATPLVGWAATDAEWLTARRTGISASDVAAILGFSQYATPWEIWADKMGIRPREVDADKECIRLGVGLEPWLLAQAGHILGVPVRPTGARLYACAEHPWMLASPDGEAQPSNGEPFGVEAKTAGLASGFGAPEGWSDHRTPLGYEFQCRWQMPVMGWSKVVLIGLVAGLGLRTWTCHRDLAIEADMIAQVAKWRQRHLIERVEPAMSPRDNALMDATYPSTDGGEARLDDDPTVIEALYEYADGLEREKAGRAVKEAATALLKRRLGRAAAGTIAGREVVTWKSTLGKVSWADLVTDLYELLGWDDPGPDIERYRKPPTRSIHVKETLR